MHSYITPSSNIRYDNRSYAVIVYQCTNIWVTSTISWSSQLHACCVSGTLLTSSNDAYNLTQSILEKLLPFVILESSCRRHINQHFW